MRTSPSLAAVNDAGCGMQPYRKRHAFTLVECSVSVLLVGILLTTSLRTLASSHSRNSDTIVRMQGAQLSQAFCQEVLSKRFAEPNGSTNPLGLDTTENHALRLGLDDVDDYQGLSLSPPTDRLGNVLNGFANWRVVVAVAWADPGTLAAGASANSNLKRIEVQTFYANRQITTSVGYRTADDY